MVRWEGPETIWALSKATSRITFLPTFITDGTNSFSDFYELEPGSGAGTWEWHGVINQWNHDVSCGAIGCIVSCADSERQRGWFHGQYIVYVRIRGHLHPLIYQCGWIGRACLDLVNLA